MIRILQSSTCRMPPAGIHSQDTDSSAHQIHKVPASTNSSAPLSASNAPTTARPATRRAISLPDIPGARIKARRAYGASRSSLQASSPPTAEALVSECLVTKPLVSYANALLNEGQSLGSIVESLRMSADRTKPLELQKMVYTSM